MPDPSLVTLTDRFDISLDAVRAVAREHRTVEIATGTLELMDRCAAGFERLVAQRVERDPQALIYGVTSAPGDRAATALDAEGRAGRPARLWTGMSYGRPLPDRVVRGIVLARLANFLGGHAAVRGELAQRLAGMLNRGSLPAVPAQSNGGSGEILALGTLFYELSGELALTPKEGMALINGSPCAAALLADIALSGRRRLSLAEDVLALCAVVVGAPAEHFAPELEVLWGDPHEAAALRALRDRIGDAPRATQPHQAAVSIRILPRILGATRRAQDSVEQAATVSLCSVTDNPVYIPPEPGRPLGDVYSTGGYHDARACPAIDAVASAHADLCQLAQRLTDHLFGHPEVGPLLGRDEWTIKPLHMAVNGWAEEARAAAHPTLLSLGAFGQNDVPALSALAWAKADAVGRSLDAALAGLAVIVSQALHMQDRRPPPALAPTVTQVRATVAPVESPRPLGGEVQQLAEAYSRAAAPA